MFINDLLLNLILGRVVLMSVENKAIINKLNVVGEISCMYWVQEKNQNKNNKLTSDQEELKDYLKYLVRIKMYNFHI